MSSLSPLIVRRVGRFAPLEPGGWTRAPEPAPLLSEDTRLFLTGWLGGLVFFGTLFG